MLFSPEVHPYATFWLDAADKLFKLVAVLVAASWTWMNYSRGRTYKRKLEASVSGEIFFKNGLAYLLAQCRLKNVGQSVYKIQQKGTACTVESLSLKGRTRLNVVSVFTLHEWIEPGELVDDPFVIPIPDTKTFVALRLNLRVVSEGIAWNGISIVKAPDECVATDKNQTAITTFGSKKENIVTASMPTDTISDSSFQTGK
jgi:hypothetical protein